MYKYMKIGKFPESLFYMERMVGYEQEPKLLVEIERDEGQSNSVRTTFRTIVKEVSLCDQTKTVRKKVSVSLVSILDDESNEVSERLYSNQTDSYRKLPFRLKKEIESLMGQQLNIVIEALREKRLFEWLENDGVKEK